MITLYLLEHPLGVHPGPVFIEVCLRGLIAKSDAAEIHGNFSRDHAALAAHAVPPRSLGQQAAQELVEVSHVLGTEVEHILRGQARRRAPIRLARLRAVEADLIRDLADFGCALAVVVRHDAARRRLWQLLAEAQEARSRFRRFELLEASRVQRSGLVGRRRFRRLGVLKRERFRWLDFLEGGLDLGV
jgi:hypothetical protein